MPKKGAALTVCKFKGGEAWQERGGVMFFRGLISLCTQWAQNISENFYSFENGSPNLWAPTKIVAV